jgi:hypothetical protein
LVPPHTPLILFVGLCLFVILFMNVIFFVVPRFTNRREPIQPSRFPKRQFQSYLLIAAVWVYLLISSPWTRVVVLVTVVTMIVCGLAVWIAQKGAGQDK